jgi:hypothetical protein
LEEAKFRVTKKTLAQYYPKKTANALHQLMKSTAHKTREIDFDAGRGSAGFPAERDAVEFIAGLKKLGIKGSVRQAGGSTASYLGPTTFVVTWSAQQTEGLTGPSRMELQKQYRKFRNTGDSEREAIRKVEKMFKVKKVDVNSRGDIVYFEESTESADSLEEAWTWGQMHRAVWSAIAPVRPRKTRLGTLRSLAAALAKSSVVMSAYHERFKNGKLDYHASEDLVGEMLWKWKEQYDLNEGPRAADFEDLWSDLNKFMLPYMQKYMPDAQASQSALQAHFAPIISKTEQLLNLLRDLSTGHARAHQEGTASALARDIQEMLR